MKSPAVKTSLWVNCSNRSGGGETEGEEAGGEGGVGLTLNSSSHFQTSRTLVTRDQPSFFFFSSVSSFVQRLLVYMCASTGSENFSCCTIEQGQGQVHIRM